MLAYPNFRDIPNPLILEKSAKREENADLFAAFSHADVLTFRAKIDRAFLPKQVFLLFRSDDDGREAVYPLTPLDTQDGAHSCYSCTVPLRELCGEKSDGLFYYHLVADTVYGRLYSHGRDGYPAAYFNDSREYASAYQLLVYREDYRTADFLKSGVMYQIFVDRFFRGGDAPPRADAEMAPAWDAEISQYPAYPGAPLKNNLFYGGDLDGVRKKLPYLRSLGVTVIYLCPIFEAYSNHKYDTGDYFAVDAMFGGRPALDRLLAEAREQGIHVLLDGVFNHTGADSRYFNMYGRYEGLGAYQSKDSPYYSWYNFGNFPDEYACWWGVKILPEVNSSVPDYIDFIAGQGGVADTYMRAGISGFRLDVADELHPSLLNALRERVRTVNPDATLIGEVWEDASNKIAYDRRCPYFRGGQLDSVMNYPLKNAILHYLLYGNSTEFFDTTTVLYAHYPRMVSEALMNIIGTHDTERILTVLGGHDLSGLSFAELKDIRLSDGELALARARLKLAFSILYFMPGIPCIFYGDEAGMQGARDPFNRRTFPWGREDGELLSYVRALGKWRKKRRTLLSRGYFRALSAEGGLLVLSRFSRSSELLLCLNASPTDTLSYLPDGEWVDEETGKCVAGTLEIPPLSLRLLYRSKQKKGE